MQIETPKFLYKIPGIKLLTNIEIDLGRRKTLKYIGESAGAIIGAKIISACSEADPNRYKEFLAGDLLFRSIEDEKILKEMYEVNLPLFDYREFIFNKYPYFATWNDIDGLGNVLELTDLDRRYLKNQRSSVAVLPYTKNKYYLIGGGNSNKDHYTELIIRYIDRNANIKITEGEIRLSNSEVLSVSNTTTNANFALQATVETFDGYWTNQPVSWKMYVLNEEK